VVIPILRAQKSPGSRPIGALVNDLSRHQDLPKKNGGDQKGKMRCASKPFPTNRSTRTDERCAKNPRSTRIFMLQWSYTCNYRHTQPKTKYPQGATSMFESAVFRNWDRGTAEEKLWRAVIARTLEEWVCGPLTFSRKAEQFLFEDDRDFQAVCSSAGMDPANLRRRLKFIRARGIQKEFSQLRVRAQRKSILQHRGIRIQSAFGT
jgi:hypothetical protein